MSVEMFNEDSDYRLEDLDNIPSEELRSLYKTLVDDH